MGKLERGSLTLTVNPETLVYCISFFYGTALYLIQLLIPFYLYSQGYSAWKIGIIVAIPNLFRVMFHPYAGAITDRIGEINVLLGSFTAISIAALFLSKFSGFMEIFTIQLLAMSLSRTLYYPAIQSYSSQINQSKTPNIFGRINSFFGIGSMVGLGISGYLTVLLGFKKSFLFSAVIGGFIVFLTLLMPGIPRKKRILGIAEMTKNLIRITKTRQLFAGTYCSFIAAIPFILISSFYPIYFENKGLTKELIGILSASYNLGFAFLGFLIGQLLKLLGFRNLASFSLLLMGASMLVIVIFPSFKMLFPMMLLLGISTVGPYLIYQTIGSQYSKAEERGASIALSSYGFSISFLTVPLFLGLLVEQLGVDKVLLIVASGVLVLGFIVRYIFNTFNLFDSWNF